MTILSVSYDAFSNSNQATIADGGPWIIQSDIEDNAGCGDESPSWCGGYCLSCQVYPENDSPSYQASFATNISVNLASYGGATSLGFAWDYWPLYCGSNTTTGSTIPITSQVGNATFVESFPSVDYLTFFDGGTHQWENASKISHNGSTSVVRGSDPNLGYIAISISVAMRYSVGNEEEYLNFYIKNIKFLITTPIQSASASSSSATSTPQVDGSSAPSSSTTTPAGIVATSTNLPAGIVAGAVVGAVAFVALFVLAVCLLRRRQKNEENPVAVDHATVLTEPINHEAPTPLEEGGAPPPHLNTRYHSQGGFASIRPDSFVSRGSYGPPPTYGPDGSIRQDRAPLTPSSHELARFAAVNRDTINENLEARLQAAGYLPTEDPSRLTPDEWRNEYGVTKLELRRLQNLYARTQQDQPQ